MSNGKKKNIGILIIVLVFIGMFLGNYGQYQLAAVPSLIYEKFSLTDAQFSSIMTSPMVPAIFFSIILGVLVDKFGIKIMGSICIFLAASGFVLRVFADSYSIMYVSMMLTGFVCTILNVNLSKIVAGIYPIDKLGKVIGIIMTGSTGAMAVAYATTSLFPSIETAFLIAAIFAVILFILWILLTKERDFHLQEEQSEAIPIKQSLRISLKSKNVWLMGFAMMMLLGGAMVISNFQVAYLTTVKGYSETLAGSFGTVLMVGAIFGSIGVPLYLVKFRKPAVCLLVLALLTALSTAGIAILPVAGIYVASFLNGFLRSGVISVMMSFPILFPEIGPKYAGTAGGIVSTLQLIGGVVIPTYIVIPLSGGNMTMYFYIAAIVIAISGIATYMIAKNLRFK